MACMHFIDSAGLPVHVDIVPSFKAGDPPPSGYNDWHEWARVQHKAGLRQKTCCMCSKWKYPQELSDLKWRSEGVDRRGRKRVFLSPVCLDCAPQVAAKVKEGAAKDAGGAA